MVLLEAPGLPGLVAESLRLCLHLQSLSLCPLLQGHMGWQVRPRESGTPPQVHHLCKGPLPDQGTYSQVPGIRTQTLPGTVSGGSHCS